ncbi:MAG: hypothetical protein ACK55Z_20480, partial [bacterium]
TINFKEMIVQAVLLSDSSKIKDKALLVPLAYLNIKMNMRLKTHRLLMPVKCIGINLLIRLIEAERT